MKNVAMKFQVLDPRFLEEYTRELRAETEREVQRYTADDWRETVKYLLGDCPAKIEAALLMLYFEMCQDPANENIALARKWLNWALKDILKAQKIAHKIW